MRRLKSLIVIALSLCLTFNTGFYPNKIITAEAAETHTCAGHVFEERETYGPSSTYCSLVKTYNAIYCAYPGCGRLMKRWLVSTNSISHTSKLKFKYCDGSYLHFDKLCSGCGYLLGTQSSICHNHPGGHPLY